MVELELVEVSVEVEVSVLDVDVSVDDVEVSVVEVDVVDVVGVIGSSSQSPAVSSMKAAATARNRDNWRISRVPLVGGFRINGPPHARVAGTAEARSSYSVGCQGGSPFLYCGSMPVVDQISVFLENRPGRLGALCGALAEAGVNIDAIMLPSGTDYGIVHVVVDRHQDALQTLEARAYRTYTSRVLDVRLDDRPGALARLADRLSKADIDIKYAYSAVAGTEGRLILAVSDAERASAVLD